MVDFTTTKEESQIISKIADRAIELEIPINSKMELMMDITATNNACPLDLEKFLSFDDFSFHHDCCGISSNLNRMTGGIDNCFLPRCSKQMKRCPKCFTVAEYILPCSCPS